MENEPPNKKLSQPKTVAYQAMLYGIFAVLMILLNMLLQFLHEWYIAPTLELYLGHIPLLQQYYFPVSPINYRELIGSGFAVAITYIVKFLLDKFIVFEKKSIEAKTLSKEFFLYLGFAILTTLLNIGIQFVLGLWTPWSLAFRITIALTCGYATKFVLDLKYVFPNIEEK